ncbi:MAG: efflux RND transporter permease subunit [Prevotella pectinovora]|uniref:efflux RND transporter permease subunit n=2 Tax=Prevotella TaxID=838 RepID=UPI0025942C97|nr:efflux RND transporter permease subunit [Prevotella pectinovora]MDY4779231.1 efflux RND transporter permease subunit [Prevotella pectinovora]
MSINTFIQRPLLSAVISVLIVIAGIVGLESLPVEQYPDIAPPTVFVSANYPGASAETVIKSVITPLEESINGVEGMTYMTSSASNSGEADITVYFKKGVDPDMAAVNVQNRVQSALANLPAEVTKEGVQTEKQQNAELMTLALCSTDGRFDENFLNNYMNINVIPRLKRIQGIGRVELFGSSYNMRLWLDPNKMKAYSLVPADITAALEAQNIEAATGSFGQNHANAFEYTMKYRGRFSTPEQFGNIVIRSTQNGQILRLRDVARVELGADAYNFTTQLDGKPAATAMLQQTAGSNASEIINTIDKELEDLSTQLPPGMKFQKINDTNHFLNASINVVVHTLFEALLLVILVVYVFLQDIRSTIIPSISIVVSIIGTFGALQLMGFSINLLTLFALVLAIGTVVDDAIIVVEAVQANFDKGYRSPYLASRDAMGSVTSALVTSTLIFMAVFIPVSMMGGTSGAFYRQFGLTMAVAVGISFINAMTLSPALCALLLKPYKDENGNEKNNFAARFRRAFNAVFSVLEDKYTRAVSAFIRHKYVSYGIVAAAVALLVFLVKITPTGLLPQEDTGMVYVSMNTRPGTSMHDNAKTLNTVKNLVASVPGVAHVAAVNGYSFTSSGSNSAMIFAPLKEWKDRKDPSESVDSIVERIMAVTSLVKDADVLVMTPPMVPGFGMSSGLEFNLQDHTGSSIAQFQRVKDAFVDELSRQPEIGQAFSDFSANYPQFWLDVDAAKCQRAGVSPSDVLSTIAGYYGGSYISNFNRFSRLYHVTMQAEAADRVTRQSLNNIYVRLSDGQMAPVNNFVTLTPTMGPQGLSRFNMFNSISVNADPAPGYSSGQAMEAVARVAKQTLPSGYGYEYSGLSREEGNTSNNFVIVAALSLLIIYLVLVALYESLILPFAILLAVPVGIMGSFLFAQLFGLQNNIYLQTGVVLLIGLLSKTAILLTEYAVKRREAGMRITQAAFSAAKARLRPILMTVLAMILGLLPLMAASGVGANGSRSLASGVVGGMLIGSVALLFLVPAFFVIFQWMQEHWMPRRLIDVLRTQKITP